MPEELSPESKLYVKEEIEKTRKEIREDLEKVKSKATKTFTTVALVVGLITGLGVYGSAKHYINTAVEANLGTETLAEIEKNRIQARNSYNKIAEYETKAEQILSGRPIIGTIVPYGGEIVETTPDDPYQVQLGWFFCNGASLDRVKYEDLYDVIGVAFGAPDPNTFNLPDLRGRVAVGAGAGEKLTPRTLGKKDGEEKHTLTINEMPKHKHRWKDVRADKDRKDDGGFGGSESNVHRIIPGRDVPNEHFIDDISQEQGKDKPHNNMQPFLVVNYIIRAR